MQNAKMRLVASVVVLLVSGLYGCSQTVAIQGEFPAAYPKAAVLHEIAVYPFSGRDGGHFTAALTAELQSASLSGRQLFNVTTPEAAAVASNGGYARLGKHLGVDAVYFGDVIAAGIDEVNFEEKRSVCLDSEGFKCKQWGEEIVRCTKLTAGYDVAPKVVSVADATLVYSGKVTTSSTYKYCSDRVPAKTPESLLSEARAAAVARVRRDVAPYNAIMKVSLKKSAQGLDAEQKKLFGSAVKFAEAGRMDRACAQWEQLAPSDESSCVAVLYDLGVCAEATADWTRASMLYAKADSLLLKPDAQVNAALERARTMKSNEEGATGQAQ